MYKNSPYNSQDYCKQPKKEDMERLEETRLIYNDIVNDIKYSFLKSRADELGQVKYKVLGFTQWDFHLLLMGCFFASVFLNVIAKNVLYFFVNLFVLSLLVNLRLSRDKATQWFAIGADSFLLLVIILFVTLNRRSPLNSENDSHRIVKALTVLLLVVSNMHLAVWVALDANLLGRFGCVSSFFVELRVISVRELSSFFMGCLFGLLVVYFTVRLYSLSYILFVVLLFMALSRFRLNKLYHYSVNGDESVSKKSASQVNTTLTRRKSVFEGYKYSASKALLTSRPAPEHCSFLNPRKNKPYPKTSYINYFPVVHNLLTFIIIFIVMFIVLLTMVKHNLLSLENQPQFVRYLGKVYQDTWPQLVKMKLLCAFNFVILILLLAFYLLFIVYFFTRSPTLHSVLYNRVTVLMRDSYEDNECKYFNFFNLSPDDDYGYNKDVGSKEDLSSSEFFPSKEEKKKGLPKRKLLIYLYFVDPFGFVVNVELLYVKDLKGTYRNNWLDPNIPLEDDLGALNKNLRALNNHLNTYLKKLSSNTNQFIKRVSNKYLSLPSFASHRRRSSGSMSVPSDDERKEEEGKSPQLLIRDMPSDEKETCLEKFKSSSGSCQPVCNWPTWVELGVGVRQPKAELDLPGLYLFLQNHLLYQHGKKSLFMLVRPRKGLNLVGRQDQLVVLADLLRDFNHTVYTIVSAVCSLLYSSETYRNSTLFRSFDSDVKSKNFECRLKEEIKNEPQMKEEPEKSRPHVGEEKKKEDKEEKPQPQMKVEPVFPSRREDVESQPNKTEVVRPSLDVDLVSRLSIPSEFLVTGRSTLPEEETSLILGQFTSKDQPHLKEEKEEFFSPHLKDLDERAEEKINVDNFLNRAELLPPQTQNVVQVDSNPMILDEEKKDDHKMGRIRKNVKYLTYLFNKKLIQKSSTSSSTSLSHYSSGSIKKKREEFEKNKPHSKEEKHSSEEEKKKEQPHPKEKKVEPQLKEEPKVVAELKPKEDPKPQSPQQNYKLEYVTASTSKVSFSSKLASEPPKTKLKKLVLSPGYNNIYNNLYGQSRLASQVQHLPLNSKLSDSTGVCQYAPSGGPDDPNPGPDGNPLNPEPVAPAKSGTSSLQHSDNKESVPVASDPEPESTEEREQNVNMIMNELIKDININLLY